MLPTASSYLPCIYLPIYMHLTWVLLISLCYIFQSVKGAAVKSIGEYRIIIDIGGVNILVVVKSPMTQKIICTFFDITMATSGG